MRLFLSWEEATAMASISDARSKLAVVFADETKQTADRNQFHELHSILQQHAVGCAAGSAYTMRLKQ